MISKTFVIALLASVVGFGLSWKSKSPARASSTVGNTVASTQNSTIESDVTGLRKELDSLAQDRTRINSQMKVLQDVEFSDGTVPEKLEETAKKEASSIKEQEKKAREFRSGIVGRYAPFCYRAGLNAAQIDQLEMMMTEHWQDTADLKAIAELKKLKNDDAEVAQLRTKADDTLQKNEKALLGDGGFRQLQEFERTLPARDFVSAMATQLYHTNTPLTSDQAENLTNLLVDNNQAYTKGGKVDLAETDWQTVHEKLVTVIAPGKQSTAFENSFNLTSSLRKRSEEIGKKIEAQLGVALAEEPKK
jgi:hypothetical protein